MRAAKEKFQEHFPGEKVSWTRFVADEESRWVVGVFYGQSKLPRYSFWAVAKASGTVGIIESDGKYRPKVWR